MFGLPDHAVEKMRAVFSKHPGVERVVLYGSRAKGNYKNGSDIDLTVMGDIAFRELLHIDTELDDLLLPWMIDISLFNQIHNPDLIAHISRVGAVFYEADEAHGKT
jgi:predicted nucleotidyltransferase